MEMTGQMSNNSTSNMTSSTGTPPDAPPAKDTNGGSTAPSANGENNMKKDYQPVPPMNPQQHPPRKGNPNEWHHFCKRTIVLYNTPSVQLFLSLLLVMSLFLPDAWVLGNAPTSSDPILFIILIIIFVVFILESTIMSIVNPDYFLSFFFWMDVIGTLSIILDIGWIADEFMPKDSNLSQKGSLLRAARAAKLGARYGRLMRLLKFVKFFRFLPCFNDDNEEEAEPTMSAVRRVSAELSEVLSRRVAALVMLLVIVVPFLNYTSKDSSVTAWADNFLLVAKNESVTGYTLNNMILEFEDYYNNLDLAPMSVFISSPAGTYRGDFGSHDVRVTNKIELKEDYRVDDVPYKLKIMMDNTIPAQWDAMYGILLIILVVGVLLAFSASFNGSVEVLIVIPLEKMMATLRKSATDMLRSMQAMDKQVSEENRVLDEDEDLDDELETAVLEKMVEKLARIVKQVTGKNELEVDDNVDKATAVWLSENFSTASKNKSEKVAANAAANQSEYNVDSAQEQLRLMEGHSTVDPTVVNSWNFDVLKYNTQELCDVCSYLFDVFHLLDEFKCPMATMNMFLMEMSGRYNSNPYHNFPHAVDVTQTVYRVVMVPGLNLILSPLEIFSMLVASIGHDVGHPGVNNAFLVKIKHDLAMRHNDKSPLENMHCSLLYEVLNNPSCNVLSGLSPSQWRESRKIILSMILGTDMVHHFEQIKNAQLFLEVHGEDTVRFCRGQAEGIECLADDKNKLFFLEVLLHCSDISNPFKPFFICEQWADLVASEFFQQGDKEAGMGLDISPMMDRSNSNLFNMQLGFIEFVVSPLINSVVNILPPLYELANNLASNFQSWSDKRKMELRGVETGDNGTASSAGAATSTGGQMAARPSVTTFKAGDSSLSHLKPATIEELKKVDERVAKFRDKITALKLPEADRTKKRRSSYRTNASN